MISLSFGAAAFKISTIDQRKNWIILQVHFDNIANYRLYNEEKIFIVRLLFSNTRLDNSEFEYFSFYYLFCY